MKIIALFLGLLNTAIEKGLVQPPKGKRERRWVLMWLAIILLAVLSIGAPICFAVILYASGAAASFVDTPWWAWALLVLLFCAWCDRRARQLLKRTRQTPENEGTDGPRATA